MRDVTSMAHSIHSSSNVTSHSGSQYSSDIRSSALIQPVHVAEYLCRRLFEVGIRAVHGVSGDYNLLALDYLEHYGLSWVGNCNELNAGHAADGYARIKGISALFTTFGVGELSALNAIAGAYAEHVPIIHVVGTPSTYSSQNGMLLHHTLGNGNHNTFADMSRSVSCTVVHLNDPAEVPDRIDHAIRECWIQSRPVYITLPVDMVQQQVEGHRLQTPIDLSFPQNDPDKEDYVVDVILRYMHASKNPVILVDVCAIRHRALLETHDLVERSGLPTFVSPMGKGAVNEALPNYCGVYAGDASDDDVRERVESADVVLSIGALKSDFVTAGFSYRIAKLSTIDFHADMVRVKYSEYPDLRMNGVLRNLCDRLVQHGQQLSIVHGPTPSNTVPFYRRDNLETITHSWFWRHMARWLQPNDIVVTSSGTSNYGIWEARFPPNVTAVNQILWGSAGYATAACQGAALAAQELMRARPNGRKYRTILFTGDGSFQLTAQEVSTMIRRKLKPIIFIICNEGHASGRILHRPDAVANDIQPWRYKELLPAFGAQKGTYQSCSVQTRKQVLALFSDVGFCAANHLQFVELIMPKDDAPQAIKPALPAGSGLKRNGSVSTQYTTYTPDGTRKPGGGGGLHEPMPHSPLPQSPMFPPSQSPMIPQSPLPQSPGFEQKQFPGSRSGSHSTTYTRYTMR